MKKPTIGNLLLSILAASFLLLLPLSFVSATAGTVICHVKSNPPQTMTVATQGELNGHLGHDDYLGPCNNNPAVPEFGLITGGLAFLTSGGAFYFLKKRV